MSEMIDARVEGFLLTVAGFFLFVAWDLIKGYREDRNEKSRTVSLLVTEIRENIDLCGGLADHVIKDRELLAQGKEIVPAPTTLELEGWTIGKSSNLLKMLGWEKTRLIARSYATARRINVNLQTREMVRSTSRALSAYRDLVSLIDDAIATAAMNYVTEAREALLALGEKVELPMQIRPL